MELGPIPPHERTWRHPSELAAEERESVRAEPTSRTTRVMAFTSGTLGLLAVGTLMVTITPDRAESPIALSATTTPLASVVRAPAFATAGADEPVGFRTDAAVSLATPIGDGRFALVTRASVAAADDLVIDVRLPSGRTTVGSIVTASENAVVVALAAVETGPAVAARRPSGNEIVQVMVEPPVHVAYHAVATVDAAEGTAVLDGDGSLVGICSRRAGTDHVRLIDITGALADATNVVPATSP